MADRLRKSQLVTILTTNNVVSHDIAIIISQYDHILGEKTISTVRNEELSKIDQYGRKYKSRRNILPIYRFIVSGTNMYACTSGTRTQILFNVDLYCMKGPNWDRFRCAYFEDIIRCIVPLPNGMIVIALHGSIEIWNPTTKKCILSQPLHMEPIAHLSILDEDSTDQSELHQVTPVQYKIISCSEDSMIKIFDPLTKSIQTLVGHEGSVKCTIVVDTSNKSKRIISCSSDKTIILWDRVGADDQAWLNTFTLTGHSDIVDNIAMLSDGNLVSSSRDNTIRIWNLETMTEDCIFRLHLGPGRLSYSDNLLIVTPDDEIVILKNGILQKWNIYDRSNIILNVKKKSDGIARGIRYVVFSDQVLFGVDVDNNFYFWK